MSRTASPCPIRSAEATISSRRAVARIACGLAVTALSLIAAGCAPKHKSSAQSAESHAPGTTFAKIPAGCLAYPPGAPGVIRTYCNGKATVLLTVNGIDHPLRGGVCAAAGGVFSLNLGVVGGPDLAGPKPDYIGLTAPAAVGAFSGAAVSVAINGKAYRLSQTSGALTPAGGTFQGLGRHGKIRFAASFTC